jgi:hypothetical protein
MANFGEAIAPELKALTTWLADVSEGIGEWAKENPILSNAIMKFLGLLAITLVVLGGLTVAVAGVLVPFAAMRFMMGYLGIYAVGLVAKLSALKNALMIIVGILRTLALSNPMGLIITGFVAAAIFIMRYWQPIAAFFSGFFQGIWNGLAPLGEAFTTVFSPVIDIFTVIISLIGEVISFLGFMITPLQLSGEEFNTAANLGQVFGELFGHTLGQCGHQHTLVLFHHFVDLVQQAFLIR